MDEVQRAFWNGWNAEKSQRQISVVSRDQREIILNWLQRQGRTDLDILEAGCGAGWLCPALKEFGHVTATDLSDDILSSLAQRIPDVTFVAGDFMELDFGRQFDVVVSVEVLSHVAEQGKFIGKIASHLRPGGLLMLATQNGPVLRKYNTVDELKPGQLRKWVDRRELEQLLCPYFDTKELRAVTLKMNKGPLRLVGGRSAQQVLRRVSGRVIDNAIAGTGLGCTLMVLASKRQSS